MRRQVKAAAVPVEIGTGLTKAAAQNGTGAAKKLRFKPSFQRKLESHFYAATERAKRFQLSLE
jgi:hypothetical protein